MRPIGRASGMVAQVGVVDQDQSRAAVGHLAAVEAPQPALGDRVGRVVVGDRVGDRPAAGLGVGVAPRVGEVELRDRAQMRVVQAVAPVVLVGDLGEHRRPQVARVGALVSGPRGGAEMLGGGVTGHGLLQLDPDDERGVVGARPQVGHRRQRRHAARRARGFVPRGGGVPQLVAHRGRHRPEVALAGEHLAEGVSDVDDADVGGVYLRRGQRGRRRPPRSGPRSRGPLCVRLRAKSLW